MSNLGAYVDWQREIGASPGPHEYITAYVEIDSSGSNLITLLSYLSTEANQPDPDVLMETHDLDLLIMWNTMLGNAIDIPDTIFSFLYLNDSFLPNLTLPGDISAFVSIIYIGSSLNVNTAASGVIDGLHPLVPADGNAVCGVIDDGFGFLNSRFTAPGIGEDIDTRFIGLWLQSRERVTPSAGGTALRSGAVLEPSTISSFLNSNGTERYEPDWYKQVNDALFPAGPGLSQPSQPHRSNAFAASHATHVTDLACGADFDNASDPMRAVKILGVQMPPDSIESTAGKRLEVNILQAVRWIIYRTYRYMSDKDEGSQPLVINISLGVTAGAKNGSGFLETYLKEEMKLYNQLTGDAGIEIVLAFGNDRRTQQIGEVKVPSGQTNQTVQWRVQPDDRSASYLEIRPLSEPLEFVVSPPGAPGVTVLAMAAGDSTDIVIGSDVVGRLYREPDYLLSDDKKRPVYILAILPTGGYKTLPGGTTPAPLAPAGVWRVQMANVNSAVEQSASVQVQRGDTPVGYRQHGRQSYLFDADGYAFDLVTRNWEEPTASTVVTRDSTHSALASAGISVPRITILSAGSSYQPKRTTLSDIKAARYTGLGSLGPLLTTPPNPDFCADGDDSHMMSGVLATGTLTGSIRRLSGTSVSAPQVTRWRLVELSTGMSPIDPNSKVDIDGFTPLLKQELGDARVSTRQGRRNARITQSS